MYDFTCVVAQCRMIVSNNVHLYLSAAEMAPNHWNRGFANGVLCKNLVLDTELYTVYHWQIPQTSELQFETFNWLSHNMH